MILDPYNSSIDDEKNSNELEIQNNVLLFPQKIKNINLNYELNNNCEIDNGKIINENMQGFF